MTYLYPHFGPSSATDIVLHRVAFHDVIAQKLHHVRRRQHPPVVEKGGGGVPLPVGEESAHPLPHVARHDGVECAIEKLEVTRVHVVVTDLANGNGVIEGKVRL